MDTSRSNDHGNCHLSMSGSVATLWKTFPFLIDRLHTFQEGWAVHPALLGFLSRSGPQLGASADQVRSYRPVLAGYPKEKLGPEDNLDGFVGSGPRGSAAKTTQTLQMPLPLHSN